MLTTRHVNENSVNVCNVLKMLNRGRYASCEIGFNIPAKQSRTQLTVCRPSTCSWYDLERVLENESEGMATFTSAWEQE